jgi:hypothetical protein
MMNGSRECVMKYGIYTIITLFIGAALFLGGVRYARTHKPDESATLPSTMVGVYHCKGYDPYLDKDYSGTITVSHQNAVYRLDMDYDTGEKALGTGGMFGRNDMSVVFQDINNPKVIGLERYQASTDNKTMSGYWVYLGQDKLGKEICTRS